MPRGLVNLAQSLVSAAASDPGAPALRLEAGVTTYAALDDAAARAAVCLRDLEVNPGDRVALMLPNTPDFAIAYYGALRAGAVIVPLNVMLTPREIAFCLRDCGANVLLAAPGCADVAQAAAAAVGGVVVAIPPAGLETMLAAVEPSAEVAPRAGDEAAAILYTSGTTGNPKGAVLSHANLGRNADVAVELFGLDAVSVVLGALPLFHSFGQTCGLNAAIRAGASLALVPRFDAQAVLATIEREQVSVFQGVPTMCASLVGHPERNRFDTSSLRVAVCGGAPLPVELLHRFEAAFGCPVMEGYGLTETSPMACFNPCGPERRPGSIGVPIPGVELRIVDDRRRALAPLEAGEIAIRGHNVMRGYWARPDATAATIDGDGWFYTGDIGRMDRDGYFYVVDRKKDMIIRGGYNVYPREIEEVLHQHPAVVEAAVVGIPHQQLGEEVGAAVVVDREITDAELREFLKEQLAAYKYPRHIWFVSELPKGPTGKILKREILRPVLTTQL